MGEGIDEWTNDVHHGDCLDVLDELPDESCHSVVTDPPYGLAFMGKSWDDFEPEEYQEWCEVWASKAKRVLKPGGHLLAFSGNRTHHRLFTGVEDAGFEIRDTVTWHYGSGFPKASDISKTIDKRAGAERTEGGREWSGGARSGGIRENGEGGGTQSRTIYDEPATDAAKEWKGWKTALKPATEFCVLARKPFDGAAADCVLEHGTGALNIDACRLAPVDPDGELREGEAANELGQSSGWNDHENRDTTSDPTEGRYPANVVFDEIGARNLDQEVGELAGGARTPQSPTGRNTSDAPTRNNPDERIQLESGGPSRYYYTSKASKAERTLDGKIANAHPTVKPQDLMEWLVRLVAKENQIVLDPFCGSGTTCKAAKTLGRRFIGIEQQAKWADVARVRCGLSPDDASNVRSDEKQHGLEVFADGGDELV